MATPYRRIRPLPDAPLDTPDQDYRGLAVAAGLTMTVGLLLFAGLVLLGLITVTRVLPSWTDTHAATISAVIGTVEVREAGATRWAVATNGQRVEEGDTLRTRENGRALLTLFDQSTTTLYPLTEVKISQLRTNRFGKPLRNIIDLEEHGGRAQFGVARLNPVAELDFRVHNGAAVAQLTEGSYIVKVTPNQTLDLVVTRGNGVLSAPDGQVAVRGGERTQLRANATKPEGPILAAEDLVENGTFTQTESGGLPLRWDIISPTPEARDVPGRVRLTSEESVPVIRFTRTGSTYHAEQRIRQTISQDVTDYSVVRLELRFRVLAQNISGGGDLGSEYPLMVKVNYLDESGGAVTYVRGFYIHNRGNLPTTNGQLVKAGEWVSLSGEGGLALQTLRPRPQFIQSVEIEAAGHDYDSQLQRVALIIQ